MDITDGLAYGENSYGISSINLKRMYLTVIVHVVEVRDLVGVDSNKLCNPFIKVSIAGQKKQTDIQYGRLSATWDQVFTFQDICLSYDDYQKEEIYIECYNANTFFKNELMGRYTYSLVTVRNQKDPPHQFYRQWVALHTPEASNAPQGFLLASVTVLGPGDTPPTHPHEAEKITAPSSVNIDRGERRNIIGTPDVGPRRGYNFAIKVYRAEHLPGLDMGGSLDPFIVVKFNGMVARTVERRKTLSPDWNYMIVLPVYTPVPTDVVEIQLWDYSWGSPDKLIASTRLRFSSVLAEYVPPTWFNFYGPSPEENSMMSWLLEGMKSGKIESTAYLGRVLMSLSSTLVDSPIHEIRPCTPVKGPPTENYILWIDVYEVKEIASSLGIGGRVMVELSFGPSQNTRKSDWCAAESYGEDGSDVRVPIIATDDTSRSIRDPDSKRICVFKEVQVLLPKIEQDAPPRQALQMYDIVLNVYVKGFLGGVTKIGHVKIRPIDVWGFRNEPEWHAIQGYVNKTTGFTKSEGFMLVGACFGLKSEFNTKRSSRYEIRDLANVQLGKIIVRPMLDPVTAFLSPQTQAMLASSSSSMNSDLPEGHAAYQLRAYVYQARDLAATEESGLISPFVKVSIAGHSAHLVCTQPGKFVEWKAGKRSSKSGNLSRTTVVRNNRNPLWYETLLIPSIFLPSKLSLSPDIEVRVYDAAAEHSEGDSQATGYIGRANFPCELATSKFWPYKARPRWLRLVKHDFASQRLQSTNETNKSTVLIPGQTSAKAGGHVALGAAQPAGNAPDATFDGAPPPGDYFAGDVLIKLELVPLALRDGGKLPRPRKGNFGEDDMRFRNQRQPEKREKWRAWYDHRWPTIMPCDVRLGSIGLRKLVPLEENKPIDPFIEVIVPSIPDMKNFLGRIQREALSSTSSNFADSNDTSKKRKTNGVTSRYDDGEDNSDEEDDEEDSDDEDEENDHDVIIESKDPGTPKPQKRSKTQNEQLVMQRILMLLENGDFATLQTEVNFGATGYISWSNVDPASSSALRDPNAPSILSRIGDDGSSSALLAASSSLQNQAFIPGSAGYTFFDRIRVVVNLPNDPVYCQSAIVRIFDRNTPSHSHFEGSDLNTSLLNQFSVVCSAVVPLREYARSIYRGLAKAKKPVDEVFRLPKFVMTREGQEHFEAIARMDSEHSISSEVSLYMENASQDGNDNDRDNRNSLSRGQDESNDVVLDMDSASSAVNTNESNNQQPQGAFFGATDEDRDDDDDIIEQIRCEGFSDLPKEIVLDIDACNYRFNDEVHEIPKMLNTIKESEDENATNTNVNGKSGTAANPAAGAVANVNKPRKIMNRQAETDDLENLAVWPGGNSLLNEEMRRLQARGAVEGLLEDSKYMLPYPYKVFQLYRGSLLNGNRIQAGVFKAVLDVDSYDNAADANRRALYELPFKALIESPLAMPVKGLDEVPPMVTLNHQLQNLKARVYIVQATDLSSKSGTNASTKPYIALNIGLPIESKYAKETGTALFGNALSGVTSIIDASNAKEGLNPFFGSWYELDVTLPGASDLEIQVWDKGTVGNDELIGSTKIDLEDRWFNPKWQEMKATGKFAREFRPLWSENSILPKGKIELWVELYTKREAIEAPVSDIRLPQIEEWELRLVVWSALKVPPLEDHDTLHMYITGDLTYETPGGEWVAQHHETDVHRFIRDGTGNFNWRMKFNLLSPSKFPRLRLMVWNQDFLSANDSLGETIMDLQWLIDMLRSHGSDNPIERPRTTLPLSHTNWPGLNRGEIDMQISVLRKVVADKNPVGNARDLPNKDPFLPEPYRESWWSAFVSGGGLWRMICCILVIVVPIIIILVIVLVK